jgi:hypothetical protein
MKRPGKAMPMLYLLSGACLIALLQMDSAQGLECELGEQVSASLGDGVTIHTCSWEKAPGVFVRAGPLELIRNGILILKLQTDRDGKLQGEYRSWNDDGSAMEYGHYVDGLKHGEWHITDANGDSRIQHFRAGVPVTP